MESNSLYWACVNSYAMKYSMEAHDHFFELEGPLRVCPQFIQYERFGTLHCETFDL
jgi:hypothetical protein